VRLYPEKTRPDMALQWPVSHPHSARPNPVAPWELRVGDLRVYYDIVRNPDTVLVRAVGIENRSTVAVGGEGVEL